jgi:class 3 adenylate cyclase
MFNSTLVPLMILLVLISWAHGCMGIHYWLRFREWYPTFKRAALAPAIILPVLAIAGFIGGGKEMTLQAGDPVARSRMLEIKGASSEEAMLENGLAAAQVAGFSFTGLLLFVLSSRLAHNWLRRRRSTIRIHCGHVIAGRMGYSKAIGLTAIGDPVNTASRLESLTRDFNCRLILSEEVLQKARMDAGGLDQHEIAVRGRSAPLKIYAVQSMQDLRIPASSMNPV